MTELTSNKNYPVNSFEKEFKARLQLLGGEIGQLYHRLYASHPNQQQGFDQLFDLLNNVFYQRSENLKKKDAKKISDKSIPWFLSNQITGMSLYVDRFCGNLKTLKSKLDYFDQLGVNLLHLMPVMESPEKESDGGYAVSDFRKVDERFGSLEDLKDLQDEMNKRNMYLMMDIVLNHTSDQHEWAIKAKLGDPHYQDYFYFFKDRSLPDQFEKNMPEIFPEAAPGSFTYIKDCRQWVMTVFHQYQWDLNFRNPLLFIEMLDNIFFYANLGVDILRIDAPAFIWKEPGTDCQNLPQAHTLLQLIKACVQTATPGMALLGEAIVAPLKIMKYFGTGEQLAKECDVAYNATQMALQWDAMATGDTRIMLGAQHILLEKPFGTTWINYTRCHDDIGLGYDDFMITNAGFNAFEHRKFLKEYYSGTFKDSPAKGALFSVNEKTGDARISGSLASLCGLEKAMEEKDAAGTELAIQKILLMQAQSFFIGGIPMLFYGDESGHINDYSYKKDKGKEYDNRWMHRPLIDWKKKSNINKQGTTEHHIYSAIQKLIRIRKSIPVLADKKNLTWLTPHNIHVAGFIRAWENDRVYCLFNFSDKEQFLTWYVFKENNLNPSRLYDHWSEKYFEVKNDNEYFILPPYSFYILEPK